ncbi:MAG: hypothetical protein MOB07_10975 [Acidobacteria bacterium]|nr:hypothetical protein [Acidobacteriota bacterium]
MKNGERKQKGQKWQKGAKSLFCSFLLLFALFASTFTFDARCFIGMNKQSSTTNQQAPTTTKED